MRLSQEQLVEITNRKRKSGQVRWFKDFMNIEVPADSKGPILTVAAYEDLVKKRLGVLPQVPSNSKDDRTRPQVRLIEKTS